ARDHALERAVRGRGVAGLDLGAAHGGDAVAEGAFLGGRGGTGDDGGAEREGDGLESEVGGDRGTGADAHVLPRGRIAEALGEERVGAGGHVGDSVRTILPGFVPSWVPEIVTCTLATGSPDDTSVTRPVIRPASCACAATGIAQSRRHRARRERCIMARKAKGKKARACLRRTFA